jgi:hypothetical protein
MVTQKGQVISTPKLILLWRSGKRRQKKIYTPEKRLRSKEYVQWNNVGRLLFVVLIPFGFSQTATRLQNTYTEVFLDNFFTLPNTDIESQKMTNSKRLE